MIVFTGAGWWAEARNQRLRKSLWSNEDRVIRGDTTPSCCAAFFVVTNGFPASSSTSREGWFVDSPCPPEKLYPKAAARKGILSGIMDVTGDRVAASQVAAGFESALELRGNANVAVVQAAEQRD